MFFSYKFNSSAHRTLQFVALLTVSQGTLHAAKSQQFELQSPDKRISANFDAAPNKPLSYSVRFKNQTVILPSTLGIKVDDDDLGTGVAMRKPLVREFRETYPTMGAHTTALNHYNEARIAFGTPEKPATSGRLMLEVRVFNDGVAYRYIVPKSDQNTRHINGESSQWKLPPQSVVWFQTNTNEYEGAYQERVSGDLTDQKMGAPVTAKLPNGLGYAMLSEANLVNYSDMALQVLAPATFGATFDKNAQGWDANGEIVSPWRVTLLADDLTALVNSDILRNLCPPPAPELANAAWIKPGRGNWHWMVTGRPQFAVQKQWVDWTKQLGFEYYLIDDGWVDWRAEGKDQWALMKEIVDYARPQNVQIWAWVHSKEVRDHTSRVAYFTKAKAAGLVGLKIDFPGRPNVEWVNWYDETLRDLAQFGLMADFHGAVKPTGRERTWPHELTREAILGRESGKLPALHDTALPFTRFVQGHADFTPTDFRSARLGGSSWTHELAQAIVYTSPFLCYGGDPENYLAHPALDILKAIPATWDETLVLPDSEIGRTAAFARRKGRDWFIGVVNGGEARPFPIDLKFLPPGSYRIDRMADVDDNNETWKRSRNTITRRDKFAVQLRRNGGFVARITPLNR